jgi:hypothetical protein
MLSDRDLCAAAAAAYSGTATFVCAGDVHCLVTEQGGYVLVAFRGTELNDIADWLRDFDAVPADGGPLGICHAGFLNGACAALPLLKPFLTTSKPFIVTGHSLGGALAICTAALLASEGNPPALCTTFGAPAVSVMGTIARVLGKVPGVRWWDGNDPVPFEPPWPYQQDRSLTHIGTPMVDPIAAHMIARYAAELPPPVAIPLAA